MPFKLGTQTIQLDTPFTHNDIQYPSNWIRLATEEDKAAIGLVWEADPVRADDRFYWDGNVNNPKDIDQVKAMLIAQSKATAGSMLAQSDWKIIRATETSVAASAEVLAERAAIRTASNDNETAINACTSVDQLAVLQLVFPQKEVAPVAP